jgi:hypothetical protein
MHKYPQIEKKPHPKKFSFFVDRSMSPTGNWTGLFDVFSAGQTGRRV